MSLRLAIRHTTHYRFDRRVVLSPHLVRLRPLPHARTPVLGYALKVEPARHFLHWQQDPYGNHLARLVFPETTHELTLEVEVIADMVAINPFDFFVDDACAHWPFSYGDGLAKALAPYLETEPAGSRLAAWLAEIGHERVGSLDFLAALNRRLARDIVYTTRLEPGVQSAEETLSWARGSCRDSAWLLVQILRHLGWAARFVSGYLVQLATHAKPLDGPAGPATDFSDLHAWAEVYLPGAGWIGLDATSGLFAGEGHIPLAAAPHPSATAPIEGLTSPCRAELGFSHRVIRIQEDPRVTRPYRET
jgi:transglutaminase-like putative cysteine protease